MSAILKVCFWTCKFRCPYLYRLLTDYIPVPAPTVPRGLISFIHIQLLGKVWGSRWNKEIKWRLRIVASTFIWQVKHSIETVWWNAKENVPQALAQKLGLPAKDHENVLQYLYIWPWAGNRFFGYFVSSIGLYTFSQIIRHKIVIFYVGLKVCKLLTWLLIILFLNLNWSENQ